MPSRRKKNLISLTLLVVLSFCLDHNVLAYYDAEQGRWMNRDPIEEKGELNLYEAVENNPVNKYDLLGMEDYWIGGAADKNKFMGFGPTKIMESVKDAYGTYFPGADNYVGYDEENYIITHIKESIKKNPCEVVNLIGHSYGGVTAIDISRKLKADKIRVNTLITLDPVATLPRSNPLNYEVWINAYQKQTIADIFSNVPIIGQGIGGVISIAGLPLDRTDLSDFIATLGNQLGKESGATNVGVGYHHLRADLYFLEAVKNVPLEIRTRTSMPITENIK